jgi:hypothetical protein
MDKKKAVDLIKLEVLGCINKEDSDTLRLSKENDENFPFKELGEYQNLIALLPSTLMLEFPSNELKDKVAMKLYSIRDEIKAKVDARKAAEEPLVLVEEEKINLEEVKEIEEEIPVKSKDSSIKEAEIFRTKIPGKTEPERPVEDIAAKTDARSKVTLDRELIEKATRDYIKSHFGSELEMIKKSTKRNLILTIAFFLITLALIALLYLTK